MLKKLLFSKYSIVAIFLIIIGILLFINHNSWKFYSIYFKVKYDLTEKYIEKKNIRSLQQLDEGKIIFEGKEFNYLKFPLKNFGVKYLDEDYIYRPLGYIDTYKDRIILISYDGEIFYSNKINEIKKNKLILKKFDVTGYDFNFDPEDDSYYRNIKIRDILIDNNDLYITSNGSQKVDDENDFSAPQILKGKINLNTSSIEFKTFYSFNKKIYNLSDWSHTGGRLIKYKDSSLLLSMPDYAMMEDLKKFTDLVSSKDTIFGKVLLIKDNKSKTFSIGHRNPQGLFYDDKNDLIFETEHGPTGGDEINLIKENHNYGWPVSTYGAWIKGLNVSRFHKKNGFSEPLAYWWPANCAISEITKIDLDFNKNWKGYTLINACLSGSYDQGESLYRWEFDQKKERVIKKEKYHIGDRIRDLKYNNKEKALIMLIENQKSLVLIFE